MKIAIDALGIHYMGGGRTATLTLLESLLALDRENEYLIFLSQPEPTLRSSAENVKQWIAPTQNRIKMRSWAQIHIPRITRDYDLVHFIKNLGVFGVKPPTVVTMYDLTTLVHPEFFPFFDVFYWRYIQKLTLQKANKIIAISQATARDITRFYQIPPSKIQVIYPAYSNIFKPASEEQVSNVRKRYGLPPEYLLHVGRIDRKKNLTDLIQAFSRFLSHTQSEVKLVLVGEEYLKSRDNSLYPTIKQLGMSGEVIFTGVVPDDDLPAIYSGALATVFPSLHEGFGLAPLEAMACGTPIIAHPSGGLGEVIGDSAFILDSLSIDCIADAIQRVVSDSDFRDKLSQLGRNRARRFRGDRTAEETLNLYRDVIRV